MESKPDIKQTPVICESCGFRLIKYDPQVDYCNCPNCNKKVELR